jgi:MFS family permease
MFIGGSAGAIGSAVSAWLLNNLEFPTSFVVLFAIAAAFIMVSWVFLALTREPAGEAAPRNQDWQAYWKDLFRILKEDHNFRRYIISNIIINIGAMGTVFITVSAINRFQVSDATVGLYTLTMLVGQTVGNLILGWMADRFGHKLSVEIGVFSLMIAFILALIMPYPALYYVVFALLGISLSSGIVSGMLVVWEFCETSRVPTYSGLVNTTRGIFGLIAPLVATQLAGINYGILFGICAGLTLIGLVLLRLWVKEPRWHKELVKE